MSMRTIKKIPLVIEEEIIAKSNPDMIKSARINRDINDEDIERFYENYKKWETGELPTTWDDLRLLSKFYGKPSFYYFLEESDDDYLKDFTIQELFEEFEEDFKQFKKEINERLELCSHVELKDL